MQDEERRLELLIPRHIEFGKAPDFARDWVMRTDQRNAELIATTRPAPTRSSASAEPHPFGQLGAHSRAD